MQGEQPLPGFCIGIPRLGQSRRFKMGVALLQDIVNPDVGVVCPVAPQKDGAEANENQKMDQTRHITGVNRLLTRRMQLVEYGYSKFSESSRGTLGALRLNLSKKARSPLSLILLFD